MLQNNLVSQQGAISPYHQFFGERRISIFNKVQRFGEICILAIQVAIMNQNQGKHCIWLAFADNHASKCYSLLDPDPPQNVRAKQKLATLSNQVRAIRHGGKRKNYIIKLKSTLGRSSSNCNNVTEQSDVSTRSNKSMSPIIWEGKNEYFGYKQKIWWILCWWYLCYYYEQHAEARKALHLVGICWQPCIQML